MNMSITNESTNSVSAMSGEALLLMAIRNATDRGVRRRINNELERRASASRLRAWRDTGPIGRIGGLARA